MLKRAIDIGADAIMISNHGGRQLDGSASPFDQLEEIADYVSGKVDLICDGGIRRGNSYAESSFFRSKCLFWRKAIFICFSCWRSKGSRKKYSES